MQLIAAAPKKLQCCSHVRLDVPAKAKGVTRTTMRATRRKLQRSVLGSHLGVHKTHVVWRNCCLMVADV
jgi:hypothetical protein